MFKHLVPIPLVAAPSRSVMADCVVGVCDPVGGGRDINIEGGTGWFDEDSEIVTNEVSCFDTVFHEISVALIENKMHTFFIKTNLVRSLVKEI